MDELQQCYRIRFGCATMQTVLFIALRGLLEVTVALIRLTHTPVGAKSMLGHEIGHSPYKIQLAKTLRRCHGSNEGNRL